MDSEILFNQNDRWFPDYNLTVVRTGAGTARVTISYNGETLYEEEGPLAFGAQFGVDVIDQVRWSMIACEVTDQHLASRGLKSEPPADERN